MFSQRSSVIPLALLLNSVVANAEVTAGAHLVRRQTASDSAFVGYISGNSGYSDPRSCSYPQTVSTSGDYIQCCPSTGSCPFYTTCSDNNLVAEGTTVACYVDSALTCNTAIVKTAPNANGGGSYLACWQASLGSDPFTFVQDIGSATVSESSGASSTGVAASGNTAQSSTASRTSSGGASAASAASSATGAASTSSNHGNSVARDIEVGAIGGVVGLLLQAVL